MTNKEYTSAELKEMLGVTPGAVSNIARRLGIKPEKRGRVAYYTVEQAERMIAEHGGKKPTDTKTLYTMREISEATGTGLPAVCVMLKKLGIEPVKRDKQTLFFPQSALEAVKAHARPRKVKLTAAQIAERAGVTEAEIVEAAKKNGIKHVYITVTHRYEAYDEAAASAIIDAVKPKPPEKTPREKWLDEQRKLHPLVTDMRCFDMNYWP